MNLSETSGILRLFVAAFPAWRCAEDTVAVYAMAWAEAPAAKLQAAARVWLRSAHAFPPAPGELLALAGLGDPDAGEPLPPYLRFPWGSLEPAEWVDRALTQLEAAKESGDEQATRHWSHTVRERQRVVAERAPDALTADGTRLVQGLGGSIGRLAP